jgi:hypothetical protein
MALRSVPCTAGGVAATRRPYRNDEWTRIIQIALALVGVALIANLASACSAPPRLPPVPADETEQVSVLPGVPNARFWADTQVPAMVQEAQRALGRERAELGLSAEDPLPRVDFLALSGGSDDGAFGAGLLIGWTEAGTRPEFKLVTGVSTGALIAPFAFLGPSRDEQLRQVYTAIGPRDVFSRRDLIMLPWDDAVTDTRPLYKLISRYADESMMTDIAREYRRGRLLLIGTTNLDVMRPVIWNIGAIAASGQPGALELVRHILLASASVPALFPPVLIEAERDGRRYDEMHVDGGAVAQLFLYPPAVARGRNLRTGPYARERHAWIIRNARLDPNWAAVERNVFTIAGRAIASMIHYSGTNDIIRLQNTAARDGVDFNLAFIGRDFTVEHKDDFDTAYMRALFDYAFAKAKAGYPWNKQRPVWLENHTVAHQ